MVRSLAKFSLLLFITVVLGYLGLNLIGVGLEVANEPSSLINIVALCLVVGSSLALIIVVVQVWQWGYGK